MALGACKLKLKVFFYRFVHQIQNQKLYSQRKEPSTGIRHSKHNGTEVRLFGPKMAGVSCKISSNGLTSLVATKYLPTFKKRYEN